MNEAAATWEPIDSLVPWDKNPRNNDHAVEGIAASIKRFGFGAPIVARLGDRMVIAGHTRLKAALSLGLESVPVRFLDVDPADAQLLALADNKLGEIASWDDQILASVLGELKEQGADVLLSGFEQAEVDALLGSWVDPFADEVRTPEQWLLHDPSKRAIRIVVDIVEVGRMVDELNQRLDGCPVSFTLVAP